MTLADIQVPPRVEVAPKGLAVKEAMLKRDVKGI